MQRWWMRAFALVFGIVLVSGVLTALAVTSLAGDLGAIGRETDRETEVVGALASASEESVGLAHRLVDLGAPIAEPYLRSLAEVEARFDRAEQVLDAKHHAGLRAARRSWEAMHERLRDVANDPVAAAGFESALGDDDLYHHEIRAQTLELGTALTRLDDGVHDEARRGLASAERLERQVILGVAAVTTSALLAVLALRRRLRRHVLAPVRELVAAATAFGAGDLDRRPDVVHDDELGDLARALASMADAIQAQQQQLTQHAYEDTLTGLPNRRSFIEQLEGAADRREQHGVLFVDLDDFKFVNDSMGHAAGDQLLRLVADRLTLAVRDVDVVGRLGGDEFAVLLAGPTDDLVARRVAERILDELATPFVLDEGVVTVGASIGAAMSPGGRHDSDELIREADSVMYLSKLRGKNRVEVLDRDEDDDAMRQP